MLYQTLREFVKYNEYPIRDYIVVLDGPLTDKFMKTV
jgi:hypothetical protein